MSRGKTVIQAESPKKPSIEDHIETYEKVAVLLRTLKEKGIKPEQRSKMIISDLLNIGKPGKTGPQVLITKTEYNMVTAIAKKTGLQEIDSYRLIEQISKVMKETLGRGESIKINGLGSLYVKQTKDRHSTHPITKEKITVHGKSVLVFKPSHVLVKEMNSQP